VLGATPREALASRLIGTSGLHAGNILVRWQVVPESTTSADAAIRCGPRYFGRGAVRLTFYSAALLAKPAAANASSRLS